jgi:hypothetical protein
MTTTSTPERKTPWHLWVVAVLTLLWDGSGAYSFVAQRRERIDRRGSPRR